MKLKVTVDTIWQKEAVMRLKLLSFTNGEHTARGDVQMVQHCYSGNLSVSTSSELKK
jgi:hypothetical protein